MILDDRERYRMLKYVYVSPSDFLAVIFGRGRRPDRGRRDGRGDHARSSASCSSTSPFDLGRIDWILLGAVMVLGVTSILAIGLILAAVCMQTRQESWSYPEAAAGALFLVSGVVFPLVGAAEPGPGARAADAADVVDRGRSGTRCSRAG